MNSFKANKGTNFIYNSDFSGNVIINKGGEEEKAEGIEEIEIPGSDILEFVAYCYVLSKKIEKLEGDDYKQLLTDS